MNRSSTVTLWTVLTIVLCVPGWPQSDRLPDACRLSGHCFGIIHELAEPVEVRSAGGDVRISSTLPDDPLRGATVEVETSDAPGFRRAVAGVARSTGARLTEVVPLDEDLESVFAYLVRGR